MKENKKKLYWMMMLASVSIYLLGLVGNINNAFNDILSKPKQNGAAPEIAVIGIDADTLEQVGPWGTWPRSVMAEVIRKLNADPEAKPAVIGIDVMYFGTTTPEEDDALVQAAKEGGNVVLASQAVFEDSIVNRNGKNSLEDVIVKFEEPFPALKEVTKQGHINGASSTDGIVRKSMHQFTIEDKEIYSFPYEIYKTYAKHIGVEETVPILNKKNEWYIPYSAYTEDYLSGSVMNILNGDITPGTFADQIVLIGPYSTGMMDAYYTPVDKKEQMYGVEIHGNTIQAMLENNYKQPVPKIIQCLFIMLTVTMTFFILNKLLTKNSKLTIIYSWILIIVLVISYVIIAKISYIKGYILDMFYIPISIVLVYISWIIINYIQERKQKKHITDLFSKYVEPQVVETLISGDEKGLQLGGVQKEIAVMFTDIRGFTPMSERLTPQQVVQVINRYQHLTTKMIFKYQGTLDKFIGDATMALFNAPIEIEDYVYKAVACAIEIREEGKAITEALLEEYGERVELGIGVNFGPAVVGNIGTDFRMEYTAIGDTVNTAARLESNAKQGEILISEAIYNVLKDRIEATMLGVIPLKGKSKEVVVYRVERLNEHL